MQSQNLDFELEALRKELEAFKENVAKTMQKLEAQVDAMNAKLERIIANYAAFAAKIK